MGFIKILLLSLVIMASNFADARLELPRFSTKQSLESIRFMTHDGRFTYAQKKTGQLSLVTSFKTTDVITDSPGTNFHVSSSESRKKVIVEIERDWHQALDLNKLHDIYIGTLGGVKYSKVGRGRFSRLHLDDEWLSWYDPQERVIHLQLLSVPDRHHKIKLGPKHNNFYAPEVVMINPETVLYTDINEKGFAALLAWNLIDRKLTVIRKSETSGTHMELCRRKQYLALGEFSYEGTNRGTMIQVQAWQNSPSVAGFQTLYRVSDNDIGQMVCGDQHLWFVKTMSEDRQFNTRNTEAAQMDLAKGQVIIKTDLEHVTNIFEMDGRIMLAFREDIFVLDGNPGNPSDALKIPDRKTSAP